MDFEFSAEQNILRDSVRTLMARGAADEYIRTHDRERRFPQALYDRWVAAGLLRLPFPEEFGGVDGSALDLAIVSEEIAYRSYDFFAAYSGSVFCGMNIARKGTPEQKRRWLPKLMAGEVKMQVSMSEPDAGSDVGALRTRAQRDGDAWLINGQKVWATGAGVEGCVINVYARTDPKADRRSALSLFLVDNDTPGIRMRKLDMLGRGCVGTYEIFFDDVRVQGDRLIGGENRGWDCMLSGLQIERATNSAGYCGGAQAVVDLATDYAKQRSQFGRPIGTFQAIGHMLADMQTEVDAARTLMWRAAWLISQGRDALREISMAKLFCSETYLKVANMGMQIMGASGYSMEYDMQRYFRDARSVTTAAGSSQMQRNTIAGLMGLKQQ